jgi:hypothetical protein
MFRPIIILDLKKIINFKENKNDLIILSQYIFQSIKRTMFLEGKIENFCIILDFDNVSLYNCPFDFIKEFVTNIQ